MRLGEFINNLVAKNTLVRIWKPAIKGKLYGDLTLLTERAVMEWEIVETPLYDETVAFVTSIVCLDDGDALNIVLRTDYSMDDVTEMIKTLRQNRYRERQQVSGR